MSQITRVRMLAGAVALGILALLSLQVSDTLRSAGRRVGFGWSDPQVLRVGSLSPGLPAERDGLKVGDRVISVAGVMLQQPDDYQIAAAGFERGKPVVFKVERDGSILDIAVRPGEPVPLGDLLTNVVVALCYFGLGLLALPLIATDVRARLLFSFGSAVAFEFALPVTMLGSTTLNVAVTTFSYVLAGLQIGLELHLASVIPDEPAWLKRNLWIVPSFYAVGTVVAVFLSLSYLSEQSARPFLAWGAVRAATILNMVVLPLWSLAVVAILLRTALRHAEARGRQQAALALVGVLPWFLYVAVGLIASLRGIEDLPNTDLQPWVLLCYPVAIFIAVYRYHLFDIERVVRRSLVYTLLTSAMLAVFYAAVWVGGVVFSRWVEGGHTSVWVVSGATLLLGFLFSPLRSFVQRMIERRFFPERLALRQRLVALAGELPALGQVPRMGRHLVESLARIFGLRSASLLLADPKTALLVSVAASGDPRSSDLDLSYLLSPEDAGMEFLRQAKRPVQAEQLARRSTALAQRLHAARAEYAVPLLSHHQMVGVLLLGGKKEGSPKFAAEELELINLVSHHAATVFENARLFESATYEGLTGLFRREAILDLLEKEYQRALRYQRPLTIGMADLDHFKRVNDTHGHLAGDMLLKRVALSLAEALRSADALGRYGGEEFLLVLPETTLEGAAAVAEKMRRLVECTETPIDDGTAVRSTISIGLASLANLKGTMSPAALLAEADRALYRAKQSGRNRVETAMAV